LCDEIEREREICRKESVKEDRSITVLLQNPSLSLSLSLSRAGTDRELLLQPEDETLEPYP
jgi:hypothetical protein